MPLINLIQEQRLAIKRDERSARTYFAVFAGAAGGAICVFGFLAFACETAKASESKLNATRQTIAPMMKAIEVNEQDESALKPRLETLGNAQTTTERWARILKHLSEQTPHESWLTAMRATSNDPSKPIVASFEGLATSQAPISEFLFRLENSTDLDNVQLKYTQEKELGAVKQTQFQIDAEVVHTSEAKPVEQKS
ncbi:MAG TPA: PilN domain-containing protein [Fimbriimonadaceae bacterium]|nr:PilN domain-containing protein [Fimbriimonadaceae bacterium]